MKLRDIWRYSKREWLMWWQARAACILDQHSRACLGRCNPNHGRWTTRW